MNELRSILLVMATATCAACGESDKATGPTHARSAKIVRVDTGTVARELFEAALRKGLDEPGVVAWGTSIDSRGRRTIMNAHAMLTGLSSPHLGSGRPSFDSYSENASGALISYSTSLGLNSAQGIALVTTEVNPSGVPGAQVPSSYTHASRVRVWCEGTNAIDQNTTPVHDHDVWLFQNSITISSCGPGPIHDSIKDAVQVSSTHTVTFLDSDHQGVTGASGVVFNASSGPAITIYGSDSIDVGTTVPMSSTCDGDAGMTTWVSSNPSVATVARASSTATWEVDVTGHALGTAIISASCADHTGTLDIRVKEPYTPPHEDNCDDPLTEEVEACQGGGEPSSWYEGEYGNAQESTWQGQIPPSGAHWECLVTDWYDVTSTGQRTYVETTVDACWLE